MHHNPNWLMMHNRVTASEGSSGTMSRSSWSRIPWNKHLVSSWSRIPQDGSSEHMDSSITHICINTSDDTISSSSVHRRWPKTLVWSSRHPTGTGTGPTPIQNRPKFGNFDNFEGLISLTSFKQFLVDTWVQPVRVNPWSSNLNDFMEI